MQILQVHDIPAKKVEKLSDIEPEVYDFLAFLENNNGKFSGNFDTCYALSHAQVSRSPWSYFIVDKRWAAGTALHDVPSDQIFPSQIIINPKILSHPEKVKKSINNRDVELKNELYVVEACMSFPHRTQKKMLRYHTVKVEYQIPSKRWLTGRPYLKTVRETVSGLRAHIFQHEIEHSLGKNMYYRGK